MAPTTDFIKLDKYMTKYGYFDTTNKTNLEIVWAKTEHSYNKNIPEEDHKTVTQVWSLVFSRHVCTSGVF